MQASVPCTSAAPPHRNGVGAGVAGRGVSALGVDGAVVGADVAAVGFGTTGVGAGAWVRVAPAAHPASTAHPMMATARIPAAAFACTCTLHRDAPCGRRQIVSRPPTRGSAPSSRWEHGLRVRRPLLARRLPPGFRYGEIRWSRNGPSRPLPAGPGTAGVPGPRRATGPYRGARRARDTRLGKRRSTTCPSVARPRRA